MKHICDTKHIAEQQLNTEDASTFFDPNRRDSAEVSFQTYIF